MIRFSQAACKLTVCKLNFHQSQHLKETQTSAATKVQTRLPVHVMLQQPVAFFNWLWLSGHEHSKQNEPCSPCQQLLHNSVVWTHPYFVSLDIYELWRNLWRNVKKRLRSATFLYSCEVGPLFSRQLHLSTHNLKGDPIAVWRVCRLKHSTQNKYKLWAKRIRELILWKAFITSA